MINYVVLVLGTIFILLFLIMMIVGKRYHALFESAESGEFPLLEFYGVGMAWENAVSVLGYTGKFSEKIRGDVSIYYGERYAEYYCRIILAQTYTYIHLCICFFTLLAGFADEISAVVMLLAGVVSGMALGNHTLKQVSVKLQERADECVQDFPNMVTKLALMISSGMILRDAWFTACASTAGELHSLMERSCQEMNNGKSDRDAIYQFGINSASKEMKKFSTELIQGMEKGGSELVYVLMQQSGELWERKRQLLLRKGEKAAAKLIIPTTVMFAGLLLVIVSSAMTGMSI